MRETEESDASRHAGASHERGHDHAREPSHDTKHAPGAISALPAAEQLAEIARQLTDLADRARLLADIPLEGQRIQPSV